MQGLGLDVLAALLRRISPSHVVVLATGNANKDLPSGTFWQLPEAAGPEAGVAPRQGESAPALVVLPALPPSEEAGGRLSPGPASGGGKLCPVQSCGAHVVHVKWALAARGPHPRFQSIA